MDADANNHSMGCVLQQMQDGELKVIAYASKAFSPIDVINVYNVYKKFFVNAFIILSMFISIKSHERNEAKL